MKEENTVDFAYPPAKRSYKMRVRVEHIEEGDDPAVEQSMVGHAEIYSPLEDKTKRIEKGTIGKMDFEDLNKFYKENPPEKIIDDTGIRHQKEVPLSAKYEKHECKCNLIHHISDETWYHSYMQFFQDANLPGCIKVVKKCKKCHEILLLIRTHN